jgi:hypothetical protein
MLIGGRCPVVGENGDSVGTQIIEHATSFDDRGIDVGQRERHEEAEPIRPPVDQPARVGADHAAWYGVLGSKTLLSAIGLDVFGALAKGHVTARLSRASLDSTSAAHAIFSTRLKRSACSIVTATSTATRPRPTCSLIVKPSYVGGLLEMANARLYPFWGSLTKALRTDEMQNEAKGGGDPFGALYEIAGAFEAVLGGDDGCEHGGGDGDCREVPLGPVPTLRRPRRRRGLHARAGSTAPPTPVGGGFDLPAIGPVFEEYVASFGLGERLRFIRETSGTTPCPTPRSTCWVTSSTIGTSRRSTPFCASRTTRYPKAAHSLSTKRSSTTNAGRMRSVSS